MDRKKLYIAAFRFSPVLALFELAPYYILISRAASISSFLLGYGIATFITLLLWIGNIGLILRIEKKLKRPVFILFSYLFALILVSIALSLSPRKFMAVPTVFFYINAIAHNTIILTMCALSIVKDKQTKAETELMNLRVQNLEAEQQQLIQQLRPHFLFNALSTLKSLIKTDTTLAEEYLIKLSDFLRFTVSSQKNNVVPLSQEVQFTSDYIDLQKIRFEGALFCQIDIPEKVKTNYCIPIYALQTLVENAIKHNAFTEDNPMNVKIENIEDSIIITNNKIPKPSAIQSGVGLQNLNKRYEMICGEEIKIEDSENAFKVTIKLINND